MPAKDHYHEAVKIALTKEGWKITHDPYILDMDEGERLYVDLGAERILAAEKGNEKIAVEIKSFASLSPFTDFHQAIGQYMSYKWLLEEREPDRKLFLAVPSEKENWFTEKMLPKKAIQALPLYIFFYNDETEKIETWKT
jgi:XisH protein